MTAGLGTLRLAPDHFWSMTPRELAAALDGAVEPRHAPPPSRRDLVRLAALFPDPPQ